MTRLTIEWPQGTRFAASVSHRGHTASKNFPAKADKPFDPDELVEAAIWASKTLEAIDCLDLDD